MIVSERFCGAYDAEKCNILKSSCGNKVVFFADDKVVYWPTLIDNEIVICELPVISAKNSNTRITGIFAVCNYLYVSCSYDSGLSKSVATLSVYEYNVDFYGCEVNFIDEIQMLFDAYAIEHIEINGSSYVLIYGSDKQCHIYEMRQGRLYLSVDDKIREVMQKKLDIDGSDSFVVSLSFGQYYYDSQNTIVSIGVAGCANGLVQWSIDLSYESSHARDMKQNGTAKNENSIISRNGSMLFDSTVACVKVFGIRRDDFRTDKIDYIAYIIVGLCSGDVLLVSVPESSNSFESEYIKGLFPGSGLHGSCKAVAVNNGISSGCSTVVIGYDDGTVIMCNVEFLPVQNTLEPSFRGASYSIEG